MEQETNPKPCPISMKFVVWTLQYVSYRCWEFGWDWLSSCWVAALQSQKGRHIYLTIIWQCTALKVCLVTDNSAYLRHLTHFWNGSHDCDHDGVFLILSPTYMSGQHAVMWLVTRWNQSARCYQTPPHAALILRHAMSEYIISNMENNNSYNFHKSVWDEICCSRPPVFMAENFDLLGNNFVEQSRRFDFEQRSGNTVIVSQNCLPLS